LPKAAQLKLLWIYTKYRQKKIGEYCVISSWCKKKTKMDTANDTPLFGGASGDDFSFNECNDDDNNDDMFQFNIGYSDIKERTDSFEIQFANGSETGNNGITQNKSNNRIKDITTDGLISTNNNKLNPTSAANELHIKKLGKHAHLIGKNLEHMSWELKEYLDDTTKKSVFNFNLVSDDLDGLESIVKASIKGNTELIEKHKLFRQKIMVAKRLHKQIAELQQCVNAMYSASMTLNV
jgi:hypothetical protein